MKCGRVDEDQGWMWLRILEKSDQDPVTLIRLVIRGGSSLQAASWLPKLRVWKAKIDGLKRKDPWQSRQAKTACLLVSLPCQVLCPVPYMSACVSNQFLQEPFFANSAVHNKIFLAFIGIEANWPVLGEKLTKTFINWLLWVMQNFRTLMMPLHCLRNYQPQDDGPRPQG